MSSNYSIIGNGDLITGNQQVLLIYASRSVPDRLVPELKTFYKVLMEKNYVLAGAWHSEFEKEIFKHWQTNPLSPLIYCASRSWSRAARTVLKKFAAIPPDRYAIVVPELSESRISKVTVKKRDRLLLQLFPNVVFSYITPGGHCQELLREAEHNGNNIFIYNHYLNESFLSDISSPIDSFTAELLDCL